MDLLAALNEFYNVQVIETVNSAFKVLRTFTYGEMVIAFLLLAILTLQIFRFIWAVLN